MLEKEQCFDNPENRCPLFEIFSTSKEVGSGETESEVGH
jgi:hypothetical protein